MRALKQKTRQSLELRLYVTTQAHEGIETPSNVV